jgi:NhaA family Na+:H+ antiporter
VISRLARTSVRRTIRAGAEFFDTEAASGVVLFAAAVIAGAWANLAGDSYSGLWRTPLTIGVAPLVLSKPLLLWINDGLMAIFFFLVGLEIKREILGGELASARRAVLPVAAAVGGMVAPAAIYSVLNIGGTGARGWGIPMATDIAFALGALALLGNRVATSLRVFLTAVAIADDLGAVAVIAIFYTRDLVWIALASGGLILAILTVINRVGIRRAAPYVLLGVALWVAVLKSGVHATVAGVLLAFSIPASRGLSSGRRDAGNTTPLVDRLEHALQPWVAFAIMPVFALANAGVRLSGDLGTSLFDPIALGIILGLVVGKQLGVAASCWALVRLGVASLPSRATWQQLYGVALLCGIGFTMSLFIATLALGEGDQLRPAKLGVLVGSLLSGIAGYLVLARGAASRPRAGPHGASVDGRRSEAD